MKQQPIRIHFSGHSPHVIAHRGFSAVAPENTLAAFRKAIDIGADMIELDVLLSKDGEVVVIHDSKVNRTTDGIGLVRNLTLKELKRLDAGSWFDRAFSGERIPTLAEVFELAKGRILLNVEIKSGAVLPQGFQVSNGIEERVARLVEEYDLEQDVVISSFKPLALERIKEIDPHLKTELLHTGFFFKHRPLTMVRKVHASAFNCDRRRLTRGMVTSLHKHRVKVNVYTVDRQKEIEKFISYSIDGIITNYPNRAIKILEELKNRPRG